MAAKATDEASTSGSAGTSRSESTYVVQVEVLVNSGSGKKMWEDAAKVTVPARTKRRAIIAKALADANVSLDRGDEMSVRVLDESSAAVTTVSLVQPEPTLEIR